MGDSFEGIKPQALNFAGIENVQKVSDLNTRLNSNLSFVKF